MFEKMVTKQLQKTLDEADYLDPFMSGFKLGYGMEMALVMLLDFSGRGGVWMVHPFLFFLTFSTSNMVYFALAPGIGDGSIVLCWFSSFLQGLYQSIVIGEERSHFCPLFCEVLKDILISTGMRSSATKVMVLSVTHKEGEREKERERDPSG